MTQRISILDRGVVGPLQAYRQAAALHNEGRLWEAERLYEIALKADHRLFGAIHGLGLIRLQQGRFDDAARLFRRALKIDRNSADAHHSLAFALVGLKRGEEAIRHYETALAIKPEFPEAHNNLGYAFQTLGRYQQAMAQYEKAIAQRPNYPEAHNNLGNVLHLLDQSEAAILHYQQAIAIRPDYAEAYFNIGTALLALGRAEQAISYYERAVAIRPNYAEALNSLGNAVDACRQHEEAIAHYEKALAIRPGYADAHANLWIALWSLGRHEEALAHYEKVLALNPNYVDTLSRGDALTVLLAISHLPESNTRIDVLAQLDRLVGREGPDQAKFENLAAFVRAKLLDKAGRYTEAWEQLVPANRMLFVAGQQEFGEMTSRERAGLVRLKESPTTMAASGAIDHGQPISLLILGPSRSGKTTAERLLSALEGVKRGYENPIVEKTVRRACQMAGLPITPWFEDLPATLRPTCREIYIEELAERAGSAQVFTNTHPIRIHDADLMISAFPNVRLLLVKRNVEDVVLRIYMRRYRVGNLYSYDLMAARDHVMWYHEMMDLLVARFPEIARVIDYEEMIVDPAATLRVAAELCGLSVPRPAALPPLEDDRKCAEPYRHFMAAHLDG
jgi:tetratricopeptide (TPR) repeat protein